MNDLKFALRQMLKNPGFTAVAVLTFAMGIGVTTAVLSIVWDVILAPPPYPDADRIVLVSADRRDGRPHSRGWTSGHWHAFKEQTTAFEALACYEWAFDFLILPDGSESIRGMTVSADYFKIIGAHPVLGRAFSEEELKPKAQEMVIILGHDLWHRRFNGDPEIIGKSVSLGRWPALTVVGVMPAGLRFLPSPRMRAIQVTTSMRGWTIGFRLPPIRASHRKGVFISWADCGNPARWRKRTVRRT